MASAAYIVEAVRTPIGKRNGVLSHKRADELAAIPVREVVERSGIDPDAVEDVIMGCNTKFREQAANIARIAVLLAGLPDTVPGTTVDRMCGSSQQAVHFAAMAIMSGMHDVVIAAGIENMSRVPMFSDWEQPLSPPLQKKYEVINQGLSAERIALKWNISREEMDALALESHIRAARATEAGEFRREIVPVPVQLSDDQEVLFTQDEGIRRDTSAEKLAALRPAFIEGGRVTAGNSSQISDGAAALLLVSERALTRFNLTPRARIVSMAVAANDVTLALTAPIPATRIVMEKASMNLDQIDVVEINEAFASVVLAWAREYRPDMRRVNPRGGAIALGHPLGASGARIMTTLLHELEDNKWRFGLQVMCIGHGQATATIIERI